MAFLRSLRACFAQVRTFCEFYLGDSKAAASIAWETTVDFTFRFGLWRASVDLVGAMQSCWQRLLLMNVPENGVNPAGSSVAQHCRLLPAQQRAVFILRAVLHKSEAFAAQTLGRPVAQVRSDWRNAVLTMQTLTATDRSCS